jgi:transcriptional repressor NrdR
MKCPYCGFLEDRVVDSREIEEGLAIRRRRQCLNAECGRRFTSRERIDEIPSMVIKKDGTRERFEREKLISGVLKAIEKRPVTTMDVQDIANKAEQLLNERPDKEISVKDLGALVMQELKKLDQVAYVRFASVYRDFRDVDDFVQEARALRGSKD